MPDRINHLAVWVAAIVYYLFGSLWYAVFAVTWHALANLSPAAPVGAASYIGSFITGLILAYATAMALTRRAEDQTVPQGVSFALFMGIALYASQTFNQVLFGTRPFALWLIDTGYVVVGFAIVGAIVGGWKKRRVVAA